MNVCVIGTGYVGLVTGTCLAEFGHTVMCIDNNKEKIDMLNKGEMPIYEPGLKEMVLKNAKTKRLIFSTDIQKGVGKSQVIFIAVSTPPKKNGECDLKFVANVAREVAMHMTEYKVIVDKSTVPVRTGEKVAETITRYNKQGVEFDIVSNPEFLREGTAIDDTLFPDRIVIGVTSSRAEKIMKELYGPIKTEFIVTDIKSAEIIKHASNSFLSMKISYINAVANICELSGANIDEVACGMGLDNRIGRAFLNAGIGYGGSCFPKDVSAFIKISEDLGYNFELLKVVEKVNKDQRKRFVKKIHEELWVASEKTIGIWGLAFKPNTDDMRNAPSVDIIQDLLKEGAAIRAYDPEAMEKAKEILPKITYCDNPYSAIEGVDALLILTEWDEFKKVDLNKVKELMLTPVVLDGRNIFEIKEMNNLGFTYRSIGR